MDYLSILFAVLILGGIAILFGALLALVSRVFAVEKDERYNEVVELLPGANCGGCGFAGCANLAEALVAGEAPVTACPVAKQEAREKIAEVLGIQLTRNERLQALVRCSGGDKCAKKFDYVGPKDCHAANRLAGAHMECQYGCLGLGSCVASCAFDALHIVNGVAVVDHDKCTGCLKCVKTCPRNVIVPIPYTADVSVKCSSHDKGADLRKICEIGCIGCKICEKNCPEGAITVDDNLATIDYSKCTTCGTCAEKCPRHLIVNAKLLDLYPDKGY